MSNEPVQPVPPAPPQKSNQTLKIVLIIVGVVVVLCCIGSLIAGFFIYRAIQEGTGPAKSAVTGYYDDLKNGNFGSAYDRLCSDTQQTVTRDDFISVQNVLPKVTDYKVTGVSVNNVNGKWTASVSVRVTRDRAGETTQSVQLVKEGNNWKVCEPGP